MLNMKLYILGKHDISTQINTTQQKQIRIQKHCNKLTLHVTVFRNDVA